MPYDLDVLLLGSYDLDVVASIVLPADLPVVTWTHAVTGQTYKLDVTGHPTMSASRGIGYEAATIPCELTDAERADIQGAVVHVHSTGWRGVVLARPEANEPLLVAGYGKWHGSLNTLGPDMYAKLDWMGDAQPYERVPASANPAAFVLDNPNATMTITQSPGTTCGNGDRAGYGYWYGRPLEALKFDCTIAHADMELRIYASDAPGLANRLVYTKSGVGTYTNQSATLSEILDIQYVGMGFIVYGWIRTTPSTPSRSDKWVRIFNSKVVGAPTYTFDTLELSKSIIARASGTSLPDAYPYITLTPVSYGSMEFQDGTSTNDKMNELMRLYPIEYGWYSAKALDGLDTVIPHVFDRPTTAAYMLRLADCPSLPRLEQALLDELTSGTVVYYRNTAGARLRLELADEDPSHPLVRSGYARWGVVDINDTQDDPITVATLANAENGRARIKGDVTTDKLLTINGAPPTSRACAAARCATSSSSASPRGSSASSGRAAT